jgi:hypothetical protein
MTNPDPQPLNSALAMKIFIAILAAALIAALLFADYKWRRWMAARRRDRQ